MTEMRSDDQMAGDMRQASEREMLINFALSFKGTRYQYGGCSPDGFDCSGFTRYVYRKIDVELPPVSSRQANRGAPVSLNKTRRGDLVFFGRKRGRINHVGLVLVNRRGEFKVIHSTSSSGVRVDDIRQSEYWQKRLRFARAILP